MDVSTCLEEDDEAVGDQACPICFEEYDNEIHIKHLLHPPAPCAICRECVFSLTAVETEREGKIRALELNGYSRADAECLVSHLDEDFNLPLRSYFIMPILKCPFDRSMVSWDSLRPALQLVDTGAELYGRIFATFELVRSVLTPLAVNTYCVRLVYCTMVRYVPANTLLGSMSETVTPLFPPQYARILHSWSRKVVTEQIARQAPMSIVWQSGFTAGLLFNLAICSVRDIVLHIVAQPYSILRTPPLATVLRQAVVSAAINASVNAFLGAKAMALLTVVSLFFKKRHWQEHMRGSFNTPPILEPEIDAIGE